MLQQGEADKHTYSWTEGEKRSGIKGAGEPAGGGGYSFIYGRGLSEVSRDLQEVREQSTHCELGAEGTAGAKGRRPAMCDVPEE